LGAPVGSMLVGRKEWVEEARSVRKMLGGGMRQVGVLAAAALIALQKMPARLHEDHANARRLAELLAEIPGLDIEPHKVSTNIVIVGISRIRIASQQLAQLLRKEGVLIGIVNDSTIRLLTHFDVGGEQIAQAAQIIHRVLLDRRPVP